MNATIKVGLFYILTFIFTIILGGMQQILRIGAEIIILPQLGPGLAALIMLVIFKKDKATVTVSVKNAQTLKYIGAFVVPLLVSAVLFLIYRQFIGQIIFPSLSGISLLILLGGMLIGAFGEELGWRGYLQPILEGKVNVLVASLLVGVLWGLWHVGNYQHGVVYLLSFILSTIGYSVIMAWILQGTSNNVVIAWLFHFAVNVGFFLLKDALADLSFMMLNGLVWAMVATIIVLVKRKDGSQGER